MFPSDKVWKNIRTDLHGHKSWPALSFISLFIITALTVSTLLNVRPGQPSGDSAPLAMNIKNEVKTQGTNTTHRKSNPDYFSRRTPGKVTNETFAGYNRSAGVTAEDEQHLLAYNSMNTEAKETVSSRSDNKTTALKQLTNAYIPAEESQRLAAIFSNNFMTNNTAGTNFVADMQPVAASITLLPVVAPSDINSPSSELLKSLNYTPPAPKINLAGRSHKFGVQFYATPSHSYRKLSNEKLKEVIQPAVTSTTAPPSQNFSADVNNIVRHKPSLGLEVGFAVLYNISDRLKLKTGAQLNIRQYLIETFQSPTNDPTVISLINYRGVENITLLSPYNNNTGFRSTQLDNKLYQISVPVGLQWDIIQGKNIGLNTEASVQPTFTLNNHVYMLSTDMKHYADGGEFLRKWNINTSVGINLTYKTRKATWQIGPQIRYQHLPTYSNAYPIKEYLLDYGVRIGLTRQLFR